MSKRIFVLLTNLHSELLVVPLSSRKHTCINSAVNHQKSNVAHLNDQCKDQLEHNKCPYNKLDSFQVDSLANKILEMKFDENIKAMDIEDIGK